MVLNKEKLDLGGLKIPKHVAVIMDGNGRWAKKRMLPRQAGHRAGVENLREIIDSCIEFNIEILTCLLYTSPSPRDS